MIFIDKIANECLFFLRYLRTSIQGIVIATHMRSKDDAEALNFILPINKLFLLVKLL